MRESSTERIASLLELRPDLAVPPPADLADVAARATRTESVLRALALLDAWQLLVLEALAALPDPTTTQDLTKLLSADPARIVDTVDALRLRALLWGADDQLHLVRAVREAQPTYPGGLAPASPRPMSVARIDAALAACADDERAVLERLSWSPTGAVRRADRAVSLDTAQTTVERLLARQLLRPLDGESVILPREVAWRVRGGRFTRTPVPADPPPTLGSPLESRLRRHLDQAAVGAAFALVHDVELLLQAVEETPHRLLRGGGLSARDLVTLARRLGGDHPHAVFVAEVALAAGLVGTGSGYTLLPTTEADQWAARSPAARWPALLTGWLSAKRFFGASAEPGAHPLGPEAEAASAPDLRRLVLTLAADHGVGTVPDRARLAEQLAWHRPQLTTARRLPPATVVDWTWREAGWLGLVALDAVSVLCETALSDATELTAPVLALFPEPVDHVLLQTDLTAIAPGPLAYPVARDLRLLADQESRGGGGVYRFSPASIRRAFDAGWTTGRVRDWLAAHSVTEVPQPLDFLIEDVQRRHGSIQVGPAAAYLLVSDPTQVALLLTHPAASALGLRQITPDVLIAAADPAELVELLRELGLPPIVADHAGVTLTAPRPPRAARVPLNPTNTLPPVADIAARLVSH